MQADDPTIQRMRDAAAASAERAYAPYSRFKVGAAVLVEGGEIFAGCNVENASYSLSICAERNALFQAVSRGHRRVIAVAVYTPTSQPTPPCGACRQVINEFGGEVEIFAFSGDGQLLHTTVGELLPHPFGRGQIRA